MGVTNSGLLHLKMITESIEGKPITARQCIKALAQVGWDKAQYIPQILACFHDADLSKYNDSMRPLIEKDIVFLTLSHTALPLRRRTR